MSLPKELLEDFDEVLKDRGYQSRSKGIRDALNDYILRHKWLNEMKRDRIGIIAVILDYNTLELWKSSFTSRTTSVSISARQCASQYLKHIIDVIVVQGDVKYIRDLTEKVMRLKGFDHVKLTSISTKGR